MKLTPEEVAPRRLIHFTPLRYPGGKAKLAAFVKSLIKDNGLYDGEYVEPYAGGAGIALELLFQEYVSLIRINDVSHHVYSFWKSVLNDTEELCRLVKNTRLTVASWDKQKKVFANAHDHDHVKVGFATFFLNRTNRSGILNGGIIGGRDQTGPWKIDARYNAEELIFRIQSIAKMRSRIRLTHSDAIAFLGFGLKKWSKNALIYLDPPYFEQGRELYYDYYQPQDHADVAALIRNKMNGQYWIVSYDNVPEIQKLYSGFRSFDYNVGYTARNRYQGKEAMFFSPKFDAIPDLVGPIHQIGKLKKAA
jgi:DNA adenine methylase